MNAVMEAIVSRRSVRAFEKKELPAEALEEILKAATYAPSGKNQQTWQFTVVKSREKIKQLAGLVETELNRPGYNMYEPEVIIIPSNDRESPFGMEDNACAMENIFLAAWSFGIGSVWINQVRDICDLPSVRSLLTAWGVPENHAVYGIAALGYPAPAPEKEVQKTGKIVVVE